LVTPGFEDRPQHQPRSNVHNERKGTERKGDVHVVGQRDTHIHRYTGGDRYMDGERQVDR
jgi:hypothetical protein